MAGEALLGAAFGVLFDRLASKEFINFFRGRKQDEKLLIKKLKLKLLGLNKVLNDAEDKQFTVRAVKEWLDELKGAVYDAEDLVDEIATQALRCKVEAEYQSGSNQVQSLISSFTKLFDDEIESKLKGMIDVLEEFTEQIDVLGLREVDGRNWSQTRLQTTSLVETTSLVDESCVYGREDDKEEIMKLLLSDGESSDKVDVIPIVGMGGVGKTTLAQLLYNDDRLYGHFVKKAWVCVSDVFDVERVTRTIVEEVTGQAWNARGLNSLQVKLKESLSGKKFLIVLDDVWNENYDNWITLMTPFKFGAHGSKIIVTTRNERVAIMKTVPIHGLKKLPEEDCWKLFSKHAFEKGDCNEHPNLERIGKEIVRKCKGLPLAAKTLGGLLRSQRDVKDWNNILESPIWELSEEKSNILPALRLSYHYLPSHLKRCFAFCSVFIKDYEFDMEKLVSIWMAQGFLVKPKNNKTVEEEGYECFRELLSRSFFQRSNASTSLFVMHDLVHDLAQYVMGDFCYRLEDHDKPCGTYENVRHFSYFLHHFVGINMFKVIKDAKCLRTFLRINPGYDVTVGTEGLGNMVLDEIISGMPRLRLLTLPRECIKELPYSIGKLIHLRFLDLSYSWITQLPEFVCTLYNLETLLLSNCSLTTLPVDLGKLISLRRLDLSETRLKEMPVNISRLKDLQGLTDFVVGNCSGSGINGLKELNSLGGAITISGLENITSGDDASEAKLKEKKHLVRLILEWDSTAEDSQKERDVLENLEPPTNLKHLEIKNYGGTKFPTWLGDQPFGNMVSLTLEKCENCFSLPPLDQMPSLRTLTINDCPEIKSFPKGGLPSSLTDLSIKKCEKLKSLPEQMHTLLPSLESLHLYNCPEIESFPEGVLPSSLTDLSIKICEKLKSLPEQMHTLLPSLKSLNLYDCPEIESFPEGGLPSSLTDLSIEECEKLKSLPEQMHTLLPSLESLRLYDCPEIESFPEGGLPTALTRLSIGNCEKLKSLPEQMPTALTFLLINNCKKLVGGRRDWGLQTLPSLINFSLWGESEDVLESFPEEGLLPPTLTYLWFGEMPDLKSLNGRGLQPLVSLKHMEISDCPQLQSLSVERLPTSLSRLEIRDCPLLVPRCCWEEGVDWHKIAHIPNITIDDEDIRWWSSNYQ